MLLSPDDAKLFFKLNRSLIRFVNQKKNVVPDAFFNPESSRQVTDVLSDNLDLIELFVEQNPDNLVQAELDIVRLWRHQVTGIFYVFRQLKKHMIFLSEDDPVIAYGVVGLTNPIEEVVNVYLPARVEAVLLPFKGQIIYDGLLGGYNISFGSGIKRTMNDCYRQAKKQQGVVTSLPIEKVRTTKKKTHSKRKKVANPTVKNIKPILEEIFDLIEDFCVVHLNEEYANTCYELAEKLSRKRPSPLLRGRPKTWACGIIRAIGWVNFLDDPLLEPCLKFTTIDAALGVSNSTGQKQSLIIRKMLNIHSFDPDWTLPSLIADNPMVWMVEVNGMALDLRYAPREIQEVAFERGMIPYIPADQETGPVKNNNDLEHLDSDPNQIYQFKITLNGSEPAIWRRIQVKDCTLEKLHEHIQTAMGWSNSHLHQFQIEGKKFGDPAMLDCELMDIEYIDSTVIRISDLVHKKNLPFDFLYEYDFGDGWEHHVQFEGCSPASPGKTYPLCLKGKQACPPDDVGGIWGYGDYLEALADPEHEQHKEKLQWNGPFNPNTFHAVKATKRMQNGLPNWR